MTQYVINIGAVPNDGTGDPLRTAFNEVNLNFDQVWATGLVGSNIAVANNTIRTTNTNGNLVLAPNGIGNIIANVNILPNTANIRNLGSANNRWSTVYAQYGDITAFLGNLSVPAIITNSISSDDSTVVSIADGLDIGGDLEVDGNATITGLLKSPQQTKAAGATGTVGQICWDANYIYVCTATNTWKRVALTGGY